MQLVRKRLVVHGLVQGVFFRDTTRAHAVARGVAGWARNLPDGTVEVVLEGEAAAVDELVRFCHDGPRDARVERVEVGDERVDGLQGFAIG